MESEAIKIYYFSGTGNSLHIAQEIGKNAGWYELVPINKTLNNKEIIIDGDITGFVFPVYFARPPVVVKEFIRKAQFKNTNYIFAIATGGGLFGSTLKIFNRYLKKKKRKLSSAFTVGMPGNHPQIASRMQMDIDDYLKPAKEKAKKIAEIIASKQKNKIETNYGIIGFFLSHFAFKKLYKQSVEKKLDKYFYADYSCTNCKMCIGVCPTGNITQSDPFPQWNGNCINCLACYHFCEEKAIQLEGYESYQERYLNPYVDLEVLIGLKD